MLGEGAAYSQSTKENINTCSSTEAKLIAVDELMLQVLWTNYFLHEQGVSIKNTVMYQDNTSAILLANNGKTSSSKHMKHINVCYFFITDRIRMKEAQVVYCPMNGMVVDYFTKLLHSSKFLKFCQLIMNK